MRRIRPPQLRKSWLFLEGANEDALRRAPASGADVLIQELEGRARHLVAAFEAARAVGHARVEVDGALVEVPTYNNAKRLLARGEAMFQFERITPA